MRSASHLAKQFDVPLETIAPTNHLIDRSRRISEQISKRFDYVVLCHVLEHVPDVVAYLEDLRDLLKPGGILFLAIPDKRRTQDEKRPSTTADELLERHANGVTKPSFSQVASFARAWVDDLRNMEAEDPRAFQAWVAEQVAGDAADVHCNVWQDRELFDQLIYLQRSGLFDGLQVCGFEGNQLPFNEFYVALERSSGDGDYPVEVFEAPRAGIFYRSCNFCGGDIFRPFKEIDLPFPPKIYGDAELSFPEIGQHLSLRYLECVECGLIGINPLTSFSDIDKRSFDGERNIVAWSDSDYAEYESDKLAMTSIIYEQYELEQYRKTNRVLDVGCGPAVTLSWLRDRQGWEVFGIDPDLFSQRQARERYDISIENGLIHDTSLEEESVDLIFMDNSLEHTFNPVATLLKAYRLLRPGGAFFIFVPNSEGLSTTHLNANAYWGHWFFYSPQSLVRILREIGFQIPRFIAIQNPVNPELASVGVDASEYQDGLVVRLETDPVVAEGVVTTNILADFFNLVATKPLDATVGSRREADLLAVGERSLEERTSTILEMRPPTPGRR